MQRREHLAAGSGAVTRDQAVRLLLAGRLAYAPATGWQLSYFVTPTTIEWFGVSEIDAELITRTCRELYAEGAALPACAQLEERC